MVLILLLTLGGLMVVGGLALTGPTGGRSRKRRLEAVKTRHTGVGNSVETQLRRIAAQRETKLDQAFRHLLPDPELACARMRQLLAVQGLA